MRDGLRIIREFFNIQREVFFSYLLNVSAWVVWDEA